MTILKEIILSLIQGKYKLTPSGWYSFNCPACIYNGEPSRDTRRRGGLKISLSDEITYHCFRCQFKAHWRPGLLLNNKMKKFLSYMGVSDENIQKLSFLVWKEKEELYSNVNLEYNDLNNCFNGIYFQEIQIPESFQKISYWLESHVDDAHLIKVLEYLYNTRGKNIFSYYDFYWSPEKEFRNSVLIPFFYNKKLVGYGLRLMKPINRIKYLIEKPNDYLFMMDNLFAPKRKYAILVEGIFDAIAIDGVGILGNNLNKKQIDIINSSGKEIIVLPDRDSSGQKIVETAIENNWKVSFPLHKNSPVEFYKDENRIINCQWDEDIKDASDAVKRYGRIFTLKSIIDSAESDTLKIKLIQNYLIGKQKND
ncbi:MAG: toprim domain-containing protein [candidate division WOR-3 bacterium]